MSGGWDAAGMGGLERVVQSLLAPKNTQPLAPAAALASADDKLLGPATTDTYPEAVLQAGPLGYWRLNDLYPTTWANEVLADTPVAFWRLNDDGAWYENEVNRDLPAGYWRLGESSGTTAADSSGNGRNGTYSSPRSHYAMDFTRASSQYLSIANSTSLRRGNADWTIATWVYLKSNSNFQMGLVGKCQGAPVTNFDYWLAYENAGAGAQYFTTYIYDATVSGSNKVSASNYGAAPTGTWLLVVTTQDTANNRIGISVNNGAFNYTTRTITPASGASRFNLGNYPYDNSSYLDGRLAGTGVWNRVLSTSEITNLYNGGAGQNYDDLGSVATGLLGWWEAFEGSGNRTDASGNGNTLTDNNSVASAASPLPTHNTTTLSQPGALSGDTDTAALFDGSSGYVSGLPSLSGIGVTATGDFTLEAWVKSTTRAAIATAIGNGSVCYLSLNAGKAYFQDSGATFLSAPTTAAADGSWHLLHGVRASGTISLYVDGALIGSTTGGSSDTAAAFAIGQYGASGGFFFPGTLDEVAIYPTALSAARIAAHYAARTITTTAGALDSSGHSYHGTYVGAYAQRRQGNVTGEFATILAASAGYVDVGTSKANYPSGQAARTIEAWIKPTAYGGAIFSLQGTTQEFTLLCDTTGQVFFSDNVNGANSITMSAGSPAVLGAWNHVVFTLSASNGWQWYLNGVLKQSGTFSVPIATGTLTAAYIGRRPSGSYFAGTIHGVVLYDFVLGADRVLAHYNGATGITGARCWDWSGNDNHGTYTGLFSLAVTSALSGGGIGAGAFTGTTGYVTVPHTDAFNASAVTVEFWIKAPNDTRQQAYAGILAHNSGTNGWSVQRYASSNAIYVRFDTSAAGNQGGSTTLTGVLDDAWHHIVITIDSGYYVFYRDGVFVADATYSHGNGFTNTAALEIARVGFAGTYLNGSLDEVAVYDHAFTAGEVKYHYQLGVSTAITTVAPYATQILNDYTNLLGYWRLGEAPGDAFVQEVWADGPVAWWRLDENGYPDAPGAYKAAVLADSPAIYYRLNETSGTVAADSSGNNRPGTYSNATLAQTGALTSETDGAIYCNGTAGMVTVAYTAALHPGDTFTFECWFKKGQNGSYPRLIYQSDLSIYFAPGGDLHCDNGTADWFLSNPIVTDLNWHHLVVTKSGSTRAAYLDGVAVTNTVGNQTITAAGSGTTQFGKDTTSDATRAVYLDEVALYPTVLSAARAATHYALGARGAATAHDTSGSGKDGTYQGLYVLGAVGPMAGVPSGESPTATTLDGASAYVSTTTTLLSASDSFTIELWMKSNGNSSTSIVFEGSAISSPSLEGADSTGYSFYVGNTAPVNTGAITAGQWYHVACTFDKATGIRTLYVNGVAKPTATSTTSNAVAAFYLGSRSGTAFYWKGVLADVVVYRTALSAARVLAHYNAGVLIGGARDWSNTGNHGTYVNCILGAITQGALTGDYDGAVSLDGSTQYVKWATVWRPATSNFYFACWFRSSNLFQKGCIWHNGDSTSGIGLYQANTTGTGAGNKLLLVTYSGGAATWTDTGYTIADNNWHFVTVDRRSVGGGSIPTAVTVDGTYLNQWVLAIATPVNYSSIGAILSSGGVASDYFAGAVDEMAVLLDGAGTNTLYATLYQAGLYGQHSGEWYGFGSGEALDARWGVVGHHFDEMVWAS